jgi:hypothetical protein
MISVPSFRPWICCGRVIRGHVVYDWDMTFLIVAAQTERPVSLALSREATIWVQFCRRICGGMPGLAANKLPSRYLKVTWRGDILYITLIMVLWEINSVI